MAIRSATSSTTAQCAVEDALAQAHATFQYLLPTIQSQKKHPTSAASPAWSNTSFVSRMDIVNVIRRHHVTSRLDRQIHALEQCHRATVFIGNAFELWHVCNTACPQEKSSAARQVIRSFANISSKPLVLFVKACPKEDIFYGFRSFVKRVIPKNTVKFLVRKNLLKEIASSYRNREMKSLRVH